jgi:hypothetical protein
LEPHSERGCFPTTRSSSSPTARIMARLFLRTAAAAAVASLAASTDGPRDQWRTEAELGELPSADVTRLPDMPPRYQMNQSTIIMPCNNSGYMDPQRTVGWSIIDFDWSNGKAIWTKQRPMMDEVVLQNQVKMSTSSSLGQTVWVYRGSMWAYPWCTRALAAPLCRRRRCCWRRCCRRRCGTL